MNIYHKLQPCSTWRFFSSPAYSLSRMEGSQDTSRQPPVSSPLAFEHLPSSSPQQCQRRHPSTTQSDSSILSSPPTPPLTHTAKPSRPKTFIPKPACFCLLRTMVSTPYLPNDKKETAPRRSFTGLVSVQNSISLSLSLSRRFHLRLPISISTALPISTTTTSYSRTLLLRITSQPNLALHHLPLPLPLPHNLHQHSFARSPHRTT
ncbi:hypothetical protein QBC39DRAFT_61873 [Podospora conica]|nr:hypothetical protein QBC39DRAFT_61873 [Schizothecium conicum]